MSPALYSEWSDGRSQNNRVVLDAPPLPHHDAPAQTDRRALDDPATARALGDLSRQASIPLLVSVLVTGLLAALALLCQLAMGEVPGFVGFPLAIGITAVVITLATLPLRMKGHSRAATAAANGRWQLVDMVAMQGAPSDPDQTVAVMLDPLTGRPEAAWLVEPRFGSRWPLRSSLPAYGVPRPAPVRTWGYLVRSDDRLAAIAPLDRRTVRTLKRLGLTRASDKTLEWAWDAAHQLIDLSPAGTGPAPEERRPAASITTPSLPATTLSPVGSAPRRRRWVGPLAIGLIASIILMLVVVQAVTPSEAERRDALLEDGVQTSAKVVDIDLRGNERGNLHLRLQDPAGARWIVVHQVDCDRIRHR